MKLPRSNDRCVTRAADLRNSALRTWTIKRGENSVPYQSVTERWSRDDCLCRNAVTTAVLVIVRRSATVIIALENAGSIAPVTGRCRAPHYLASHELR